MNWKKRYESKPITEFVTGKWYKFIGKTKPVRNNNPWVNQMLVVLDNNPIKCIDGYNKHSKFENMDTMWDWVDGFKLWREVPPPDGEK